MALQLSISLESGITCPEAYARISSITHGHSELTVHVETWASAQSRTDLKPIVRSQSYMLPFTETSSLAMWR